MKISHKYFTHLFLISILVLGTGCTTVSHQAGGEINPEDMAVIVDTYLGSLRHSKAGIVGVDGESFNFIERVNVPPGVHRVNIQCMHGYDPITSPLVRRTISFVAEPGHKYQAKCSKNRIWRVWIEDTETEKIVGTGKEGSYNALLIYPAMSENDKKSKIKKVIGTFCPNADLGHADAQKHIGDLLYLDKYGLKTDLIRAYVWYKLSTMNGDIEAAETLNQLANDLSPEQLIEAKQQFDEWSPGQCKSDLLNAMPE